MRPRPGPPGAADPSEDAGALKGRVPCDSAEARPAGQRAGPSGRLRPEPIQSNSASKPRTTASMSANQSTREVGAGVRCKMRCSRDPRARREAPPRG